MCNNNYSILVSLAGQIIEIESLFTYPAGTSFSNFTFPDHIPPFLSDVVGNASAEIISNCNNNPQCIFDTVETGNSEIGAETLNIINSNKEDVMVVSKSVKCSIHIYCFLPVCF